MANVPFELEAKLFYYMTHIMLLNSLGVVQPNQVLVKQALCALMGFLFLKAVVWPQEVPMPFSMPVWYYF